MIETQELMEAETYTTSTEAQFCVGLIYRGETVEDVRKLITVTDANKQYLLRVLNPVTVAAVIARRQRILAQFEKLLANPKPVHARKKMAVRKKPYAFVSQETKEQIREVLRAEPDSNMVQVAARFAVSVNVVSVIRNKIIRGDEPTSHNQDLTDADCERVKKLLKDGCSVAQLAERFDCSFMTIQRIRTAMRLSVRVRPTARKENG